MPVFRSDETLLVEGAASFRSKSTTLAKGTNVAANALNHRLHALVADKSGTAATTYTRPVFVAYKDCTILGVRAGAIAPNQTGATVDVDLLKNGSSILSSAIQLTDADSARELKDGTSNLTSTTLAAGDVLELDFTATAGGGTLADGVFAEVIVEENGD